MNYLDYSPLLDTTLVIALAVIVLIAYRDLSSKVGKR